jgi:hypothetical protein
LNVLVECVNVIALFDTGASRTVISYLLLKKLQTYKKLDLKFKPNTGLLTASNGTNIDVLGSIELNLEIGNQSINGASCLVVNGLTYELIIGSDLILHHLGTIVINSSGLHFQHNSKSIVVIPRQAMRITKLDQREFCLLLVKPMKLESAESYSMEITTDELQLPPNSKPMDIIFTISNDKLTHVVQTQITSSKVYTLKIIITNSSGQPLSLPAFTIIGQLQLVNQITPAVHNGINSMLVPEYSDITEQELIQNLKNCLDEQHKEMDIANEDEFNQLCELLCGFPQVFASNPKCPTQTTKTVHYIDTGDALPIQRKPYPIAHAEEATIRSEIEMLLQHGLIERSNSDWGFPIVMVDKKDGSRRMCIDYRKLNQVTKASTYPLPLISDLLQQFHGDHYFSSIDLASGYWQIPMHPQSQDKTTFNCKFGSFRWKVMPFGLRNAPATFQCLMDEIFGNYKWQFICVYFDDIVIHSKTFEEHLCHLKIVMECLKHANLQAKMSKCQFLRKELVFVGHLVTRHGIAPDSSKVESIRSFPRPKNTHDVRSFVGLCSYYRKFIPQFATMATPLHALQSKLTKFNWTPSCEIAFESLKQALSTTPVLVSPNFDELFLVQTDASDVGIGAVLAQLRDGEDHPVAYASRTLNKAERNYSTTDKECLAIIFAVRQFRQYLLGTKFHLYTDHAALQFIHQMNKSKDMHKRHARYQLELQEFTFDAFHRAGRRNANADALSRHPIGITHSDLDQQPVLTQNANTRQNMINAILTDNEVIRTVKALQAEDEELKEIMAALQVEDGKPLTTIENKYRKKYALHNGLIYKQRVNPVTKVKLAADRLCVPLKMRAELLFLMHGNRYAAHLGIQHTYELVHQRYYWKNMFHDVQNLVRSCPKCASSRYPKHPTKVIPQPPLPPGYPFEEIAIDVLGDFPATIPKGNKYIVVITCKFSKWCECYATADITSATIAYLIAEEFIPRHGAPRVIYSDRGTNFISQLMDDLYQYINARKITTTPYNPQANGQVERFNHTLCAMLRMFVNQHHTDWDIHLNVCQFAYRISVNATTKYSPFYLVYGREPRLPIDVMLDTQDRARNENDYVVQMIKNINESHELARKNILVRRAKLISELSMLFNQTKFAEGSLVYHLIPDSKIGLTNKLRCRWKGPMKVIKFLAPSTYILQHATEEDAPLIHVSARRMKAYEEANELSKKAHEIMEDTTVMERVGQSRQPADFIIEVKSKDDEGDSSEEHEYYQVDRILDRKLVSGIPHYLVHWKGYGEDANSWVSLADFHDYAIIYKYERKLWQQLRQSQKGNKIIRDSRRFKRTHQQNINKRNTKVLNNHDNDDELIETALNDEQLMDNHKEDAIDEINNESVDIHTNAKAIESQINNNQTTRIRTRSMAKQHINIIN